MLSALPLTRRRVQVNFTMAQPNIIFILADDLGWADLSSYGRVDYKTPHLDALAASGLKLTNGYANSAVCSATRVSLITGQYQYRYTLGLEEPVARKEFEGLPLDTPTLPLALKKQGYATHLVGKWHLGTGDNYRPQKYGYDTFFGFLGGAIDYYQHKFNLSEDNATEGLIDQDAFVKREGYLTDILGDEAVKVVESWDTETPHFLSLHFNAPHWPWEGPDKEGQETSEQLKQIWHTDGGNLRIFGEMVKNMDANIGRVVKALEAKGITNNLIVFTSDNGGERFGQTYPLIGYKSELLEGGIRVPLILNWPEGEFTPGSPAETQVMTTMDFFPTLLAAAGYKEPLNTDGENLLPVLQGHEPPHSRTLFWRFKGNEQSAVRSGKWKYIKIGGYEYLFDLDYDERERADFQRKHPDIFNSLKQKYLEWEKDMLPYSPESFTIRAQTGYADRY